MATTPTQNPQYLWRFWSCQKRRFHTVYATSEKEARSLLPDAPCLFAAKVHVAGGVQ
ncbi:host cell division inhibitor Icd-like protein [Enterobacter soli]|uniref:host cell division inhibitor Icd-like protein n=1 Tax=Enterobacter soli TaxID=885040 RepID=UPI002F40C1C4